MENKNLDSSSCDSIEEEGDIHIQLDTFQEVEMQVSNPSVVNFDLANSFDGCRPSSIYLRGTRSAILL